MVGIWLVFISACWVSRIEVESKLDDKVVDTDDDTDLEGGCQISAVEPNFGTTAGGVKVSLTVQPVGDSPIVLFGSKEAEVLTTSDGEIRVKTPAVNKEGLKSIEVIFGETSCSVEGGFAYFKDGEGKQGSIGAFYWMVPQGTYWGDDTAWGEAYFAFIEPSDVSYREFWGPSLDWCANDYVPATELEPMNSPEQARLQNGAAIIDMTFDDQELEYQAVLEDGDFLHQSSYDLMPTEVQGWPAFEVEQFIRTPPSIRIISPDMDGEQMAVVYETDLTLYWNNPGSGDFVVVQLNLYGFDGKYLERVRCLLTDDGTHTVPRSIWDAWEDYGYIVLNLGRVRESEAVLPFNRSRSGVVGVSFTAGAVTFE